MDTKICNKCNEKLPLTDFYKNKLSKDGRQSKCKQCYNLKAKADREYRRIHLQTTYIYVITHPYYDGWCKIGRTTNIESRLSTYNTGCPLRAYNVDLCLEVRDVAVYENYFRENVESNGYEWFIIEPTEASKIIKEIKCNEGI